MNIKTDVLIDSKIGYSYKWSTVTEIAVKIIAPILNIILAHILVPEAFAPLATINMIISFGEIFVESGFRKFLIQHDFNNDDECQKYYDVALWSSIIFSLFLWMLMIVFSKQLAIYLGSQKTWKAIAVSGVILPLYSICGILNSRLQKKFQFKKLFTVRFITALVPLFITIPLALLGLDYWSLVIGNIIGVAMQTISLALVSNEKIDLYFSLDILKRMLSYASWTLLDGVTIWLTSWVDSLIIAKYMNEYYLGLYKNSLSMVNGLSGLITASIVPVLFVGLSKYQNDENKFSNLYNSTQRILAMLLLPIGFGCLIYSDFLVILLFGNKWIEASKIVGIASITSAFRTVYVGICSDAYRAKGFVRIPFILQLIDLIILVSVCVLSAKNGFWSLVRARCLIKLDLILPEILIMNKKLHIDFKKQFINMFPIYISTIIMSIFCILTKNIFNSCLWYIIDIVIAAILYFVLILMFPISRNDLLSSNLYTNIKKSITNKISKRKYSNKR